jgi:hypothetical protein
MEIMVTLLDENRVDLPTLATNQIISRSFAGLINPAPSGTNGYSPLGNADVEPKLKNSTDRHTPYLLLQLSLLTHGSNISQDPISVISKL